MKKIEKKEILFTIGKNNNLVGFIIIRKRSNPNKKFISGKIITENYEVMPEEKINVHNAIVS